MKMKFLAVAFFSLFLLTCFSAFAEDYIIGEGDVLGVSVWGEPELSVQVTVRPDGKITLPAAGDVKASGQTPADLSKNIGKVLRKYVQQPIVTVTVSQITNNRIYVSGGGVPSEVVEMPGKTLLFKFLCRFESLENADLKRSYIMRKGKKIETDFYRLFVKGDFSQDVELQADDIVFLPTNEHNKIYVVGAVNAPTYIFYREGIKVLDAILEAGGFTEFAKLNSVTILRGEDRIKVRLKDVMKGKDSAMNIFLKPGDYIMVEEGLF
jgi:polysaccharide biosynthesis/export protein